MPNSLFDKIMKKISLFIFIIFGLIIGCFSLAQSDDMMKGQASTMDEQKPKPVFIYPQEVTVLTGQVEVALGVKDALSVEFYLRRQESLVPIDLGIGVLSSPDIWKFSWNTISTPNGNYILFPKITNKYGTYLDTEITIQVNNIVVIEEEKIQTVEEELQSTQQQIEEQAQETSAALEATKEEINKETGTLNEQVENNLNTVVEKVQETAQLEMQINNLGEEKEIIEQKIARSKSELEEVQEKEIDPLIKDKTEILQGYELEKQEKENQILAFQGKLEENKKEIEKLLKKITEEIVEIAESGRKQEVREKIQALFNGLETQVYGIEKAKVEIAERLSKDSDNDNISDIEEIRLGTNPVNPDSDGDGYIDGQEILNNFNPLNPSPAEKIIYQDVKKVKPKMTDIYKVERIEMTVSGAGQSFLKFEGKGLPNSFVTLYVYSSPIIMTTKTDENGNWIYILEKPLDEGQHEVYVAVTNNKGEVTARSEVFPFIKTAGAVVALAAPSSLSSEAVGVVSPVEVFQKSYIILTLSIVILGIGIVLIIIGLIAKKQKS